MKKYRKKPVVIDAVQFNSPSDIRALKLPFVEVKDGNAVACYLIRTLEGEMKLERGDWLIRGIAGEFYPCKPDIFAKTYDLA
jgi:hypothetical protein